MEPGTPRSQTGGNTHATPAWNDRAGRLYGDLRRPARAMLRRAFGSTFGDAEIEDVYGNAWLGTLRALERRHEQLSDEEIRRYVLTAVAHHASKELRRRQRRPTAPLEDAGRVADGRDQPDERVAGREQAQVTRDVLGTLPPRRRAVMLFRYGMGLQPAQVCGLIEGLSPRAYRKEITRGVEELTEKLRLVERGDWCAEREGVVRAFAAGAADDEQERQARRHLAHCRSCAGFVSRLSGHLEDVGSWLVIPAGVRLSGADGGTSAFVDLALRVREKFTSALPGAGSSPADAATTTLVGARGAGAAGLGGLAKLAGVGGGSKLAAACLATGAATVCIAAGVVPGPVDRGDGGPRPGAVPAAERARPAPHADRPPAAPVSAPEANVGGAPPSDPATAPVDAVASEPEPEPPPQPPAEQEFGLAAPAGGASSVPADPAPVPSSDRESAAAQQFGP